jgi:hypothetical protein
LASGSREIAHLADVLWHAGTYLAAYESTSADQRESEVAMSEIIHGACLCGGIEFDVQASHQFGADSAMGVCHCTRCQRWSGSSGFPFVVVAPERFKVTKGKS